MQQGASQASRMIVKKLVIVSSIPKLLNGRMCAIKTTTAMLEKASMDRVFAWTLLAIIALGFGSFVRADTCSECKKECNTSEQSQSCVSEANEPGGYAGCGALIAACIARCSCPDPNKVQACILLADRRYSDRTLACLHQYSSNPTGCTDQSRQTYFSDVANCKTNP